MIHFDLQNETTHLTDWRSSQPCHNRGDVLVYQALYRTTAPPISELAFVMCLPCSKNGAKHFTYFLFFFFSLISKQLYEEERLLCPFKNIFRKPTISLRPSTNMWWSPNFNSLGFPSPHSINHCSVLPQ